MSENRAHFGHYFLIFILGAIFAVGLGISGMTDPRKVVAFLDITGKWDLTLLVVLLVATGVNLIGYQLFVLPPKRERPVLWDSFSLPTKTKVEWNLIVGPAIFGIGWALGGYCPGPALTSIGSLNSEIFIFIGGMALGQLLFFGIEKLRLQ